jgi:hypothetical protein
MPGTSYRRSWRNRVALVDVMSPNLIAFSCPADLAQGVAGRLSQLQEAGFLEYETGRTVQPDDH